MPIFNNAPPADADHSGYRLIRTPPAHALQGHIISNNIVGCNTHFVGNRTIPCEGEGCEPCQNGIGWRWHGYVLILSAATQEVAIFESTARAAAAFAVHYQTYGSLRGAIFKATRANARPNGRVLIQLRPGDLTKVKLPPDQPVEKLLCHIWNIPPVTVSKQSSKPRMPFDHASVDRAKDPATIPINHAADVTQAVSEAIERRQAKANGNGARRQQN